MVLPAFTTRLIRFLLLLLPIVFVGGCDSDPSVEQYRTHLMQDTTGKTDPFQMTGDEKKSPKREEKQSLVLESARNADHFNPKTWLKSDLSFYKRPNPLQISQYDRVIKKMSRRYGFDWRLIAAQIYTESNFRNDAKSHVGAAGLMQIMPETARFLGTDPTELLLPEINIALGCRYNQRLYSLWGRQTKDPEHRMAFALASYNAGRGRVLRSYDTEEGKTTWKTVHPDLPEETQIYVHKIYLKYDLYKKHVLP